MWALIAPALEWAGLLSAGWVAKDLADWFGADDPVPATKDPSKSTWYVKIGVLLAIAAVLYLIVKWIFKKLK